MFVERPPLPYRLLFPGAIWRIVEKSRKTVYLTFDDGPVPDVTPRILDILDHYGIKATFFMVGDNVRRYPGLLREVVSRGHCLGNHTMHHLQGVKTTTGAYVADVAEAAQFIKSNLFRPPHGLLRIAQRRNLEQQYRLVMHDVVTRDYSRHLSPSRVIENVRRYTRPGSIIVFHDSVKAARNVLAALPESIKWLLSEGYEFKTIPLD